MKVNFKILSLAMFVLLVLCVGSVSATDIESTDDVSDIMEVDEVTDVVEDVEIDDATEDVVEGCSQSATNPITVNSSTYSNYFDANGYFNDPTVDKVTFDGSFGAQTYGNFKFNQSIIVTATAGSTFTNVGFDLLANGIKLNGVTITMTAPSGADCYAINVANSDNTCIVNNVITYTCGYANAANYNYVVKVKDSSDVTMNGNTITATLPMKTVDYSKSGMDVDLVAGVAVANANRFNFVGNTLSVTGNIRDGLYPTLDAFLIYDSENATIERNTITEKDIVSQTNEYSYIYGIDVFRCNNIKINNNTVTMNADDAGGHLTSGNGTGAAYCVQLTGSHTGVMISNNTLTTKNHGPNAAIYSQNYYGYTNITICGNTIQVTGHGSASPWDVVTGMELQDNYATVCGNTITVTNDAEYDEGYNVYGISYCQQTSGDHTYIVTCNNVTVINGLLTIYIIDGVNCNVTCNNLEARLGTDSIYGNETVSVEGQGNIVGPNP